MGNPDFKLINTFRTDSSFFELYKNESGQFKTVKTIQGSYVPEEEFYDDLDQLVEEFSDQIPREEILG